MLFKQKLGQTNVTSFVERVSRLTVILKNPNKRTKPVMDKITRAIKDLPHQARRSITFDLGSEFMSWLPRNRDIRSMAEHDMKVICDRLNNTPRKCHGWKTPAEVFR
jgi:IS30 family transposase